MFYAVDSLFREILDRHNSSAPNTSIDSSGSAMVADALPVRPSSDNRPVSSQSEANESRHHELQHYIRIVSSLR